MTLRARPPRRLLVLALLLAVGCSRAHRPGAEGSADGAPLAARASLPALDVTAATVGACNVTYACFLSHPGLGSSSRSTSVDFSTCTRTLSSASGPYESAPQPVAPGEPKDSGSTSQTTKIAPAACKEIQSRVLGITPEDVRTEQESAQIDSTACALTLYCPSHAGGAVFTIQRQTLTGSGRVVTLIRDL